VGARASGGLTATPFLLSALLAFSGEGGDGVAGLDGGRAGGGNRARLFLPLSLWERARVRGERGRGEAASMAPDCGNQLSSLIVLVPRPRRRNRCFVGRGERESRTRDEDDKRTMPPTTTGGHTRRPRRRDAPLNDAGRVARTYRCLRRSYAWPQAARLWRLSDKRAACRHDPPFRKRSESTSQKPIEVRWLRAISVPESRG
jgi:hypothetical protein